MGFSSLLCVSSRIGFLGLFSLPAPAQLFVITEVVPVFATGVTVVEIVNVGAPGPASGHSICTSLPLGVLSYAPLPNGGIVATNSYVRVFLGSAGVNTPNQLFLPASPQLSGASGTVVIYLGAGLQPSNLVDYVSWGGSTAHILDAFSVGQWNSPTATVTAPIPAASSIAYDGTGDSADDWYIDATPTLGGPNDVGDAYLFGIGCPGTAGVPVLQKAPGSRPFVGSTFDMRVAPLPVAALPFALGLLGVTPFPLPVDLTIIGMPGCLAYASQDLILPAALGPGFATISLSIPAATALVGSVFYIQAAVLDPPANSFGFVVSNAAQVLIGAN